MTELSAPDALLHPVRLRLVAALGRGRRTTRELAALLPDVPTATLYRQVSRLADAGLIEVVEVRPVRGAVERVYALAAPSATGADADVRERGMAFVLEVVGALERYAARDGAEPKRDGVTIASATVWLSDDELAELREGIEEAMVPARAYRPAPWRRPRLVAGVAVPVD